MSHFWLRPFLKRARNQMFMKKFWISSNPQPTNPAALIATCDASIQWSLSQP
jgi:hypothetical protein